jgi:hypothetical protein
MKKLLLLCALLVTATAHAQWRTETYSLKGGWNAIYLGGDATYETLENLFPEEVLEVWRWNPNPNQVQFTQSPLIPSAGSPEWSVWKRGLPAESNLSQLSGQASYLVKCSGTIANSYSVSLKQSPLPPKSDWVRNGANLLGFPSLKNGSNYPVFTNYFATYPAAIATNTRIYKYIGGDLGAGNPVQVFATGSERLDRTQAYWFSAEVVGNFYAPMEISPSTNDGLAFGRSGSIITVRVRNRSTSPVTLTMTPVDSESAPQSQAQIAGPVPITRRTFNATTLLWTETPITSATTEAIGPQSTVELSFGINRSAMGGSAGDLFASFLRLTDSGNLMDVYLPATARQTSLSGLWVGDANIISVASKVSNSAKGVATVTNKGVTAITVSGSGGFGYTTAPEVIIAAPASGSQATATATVANGSVTGFTVTNPGSGYLKVPSVIVLPPPPIPATMIAPGFGIQPVAASFPLRMIVHIDSSGYSRVLSQVFIGQLAAPPHNIGLTTSEDLLKQDAKASAQRLVAAHMPMDRIVDGGWVASGLTDAHMNVPFNDPTNPFVHQYHPDHDNRNARGAALGPGQESYSLHRRMIIFYTPTPPLGSKVTSGWGSTVIGGSYVEQIDGLFKQSIEMLGSIELRRVSEVDSLLVE